ncbi:MAG: glycosyltransferase WbuB [Phycisphaera sp.]|nr:MAG: glycosyltransferase WbuB [Phycisphaera sp.]
MRLTIINQFYTPDISPTAHLTASLAEHFASKGHDVAVITSRGGYSKDAEKKDGAADRTSTVNVRRIWTPQFGKASIAKRLADYFFFYLGTFFTALFMRKQDVIITLTTPPFVGWTAVLHKMLHSKTKVILWNMDCYPEAPERAGMIKTDGFISKLLQLVNRGMFKRLDHMVGLDTAMVDLLMDRYDPANRDRRRSLPTTIIPNWEDADFFPVDAEHEPWEGIDRHNLAGKFVILYLGNMGVGHEFETVLDAAEQLKDNDNIAFLFIGGGKRKDTTAEEAKRRGLDNVIVQGYVPKAETPSVMSSVSCSLITLRDNMLGVMSPSKLHSNLAMRLPILYVGPKTSNVDDAIERFNCGLTLKIGDAEGLAKAVRELASDRQRFSTMQTAARSAFDEAYNDKATHAAFDKVIEIVTAGAHA